MSLHKFGREYFYAFLDASSSGEQHGCAGNILRDDLIQLTGPARKAYPIELRWVVGEPREMVTPERRSPRQIQPFTQKPL